MKDKKVKNNVEIEYVDVLDILLDEDNTDPITLIGENGRVIRFEQISVIPYQVHNEKRLYCLLKPIDKIEGIGEDQVVVFRVDTNDDGISILNVEQDMDISERVFDKFLQLLEDDD